MEIDKANAEFWNELCASAFAKRLGITNHSAESLKKFDDAYLGIYPYLLKHVNPELITGKKVLEVGLGWGTLGQKIAEIAADYIGLDVAEGPVKMMNHRLSMKGLFGRAIQGSILRCPLEDNSIDGLVSIGCFHHTGNVQRCIDETYRILKQGGYAFIMVYNRFSYWQWIKWPKETFKALLYDFGLRKDFVLASERQRKSYDSNLEGQGAPETVFLSIKQLRKMFSRFSHLKLCKEDCTRIPYLFTREQLLPYVGKAMGLYIYIIARK